ncbi:PREDICTED: pentatricopeptide repeat-containing protein At3g16610-like [Camelina sativa]|uniref:Pentatricopeptide repeat-containing protein At3g16610-like n=1 Tax=Camelina sativa TaxID=90675 RepID=A0ABM0WAR3_CAMSA|nr:PREDICTED: pentatricopeptide repeat-containing protein At3g16610-like [Camelina sativa]
MYLRLLETCIRSRNLTLGQIIHQHLLKRSLTLCSSTLLVNLTRLYASCNQVELARQVFDEIPHPKTNPISWDVMIRAYASNDFSEKALDLYYKMLDSGVRSTKYTYPFVLKACAGLRAMEDGKLIHSHVTCSHFTTDMYVCTALVDFYAKCGELDMALQVFDKMPKIDIVSWNAMISGFSLHCSLTDVIGLFLDMRRSSDGLRPNLSTIVGMFPALGKAGALREGRAVHGYCTRMGFSNDLVFKTGILDVYGKSKCIIYARRVFDSVSLKNGVTWSAMIGGYIENEMIKEAGEVFVQMLVNADVAMVTPVAIGIILMGCARFGDLNGGRCVHCYAVKAGFMLDLTVGNTIISFYAKYGSLCDAFKQFSEIGLKDVISYNSLISGCVENCRPEESLRLFHDMKSSGVRPDITTLLGVLNACSHLAALGHGSSCQGYCVVHGYSAYTSICNALMDMYTKCGKLDVAMRVFDTMHKRDIVSWNTMLFGFGIHGLGKEALSLFKSMRDTGVNPDEVTFLAILSACSHSGLVDEGKQLFKPDITTLLGVLNACSHLAALGHGSSCQGYCVVHGYSAYTSICNALMDMYTKCGKLDVAMRVFDTMHKRDIVSWNTMLFGFGIHGLGKEALSLFKSMRDTGVNPDEVTFLAILSACSHSGLVDEGKQLFKSMSQGDFNVIPRIDHYICMTDLLARAGYLDEAYDFINKMPFEPDIRVLGILLSACWTYNNVELGDEVSKKMQSLGGTTEGLVLLSNTYSAAERWEDAENIRMTQKKRGLHKSPGFSWVDV